MNIEEKTGNLFITLTNGTELNLGCVKGSDGKDGAQGEKGDKGDAGEDGVGISSASVNDLGELVLVYSDDSTVNLGTIVGKDGEKGETGAQGEKGETGAQGDKGDAGEDGIGIAEAAINEEGILIITLTDGTEKNLGTVVGKDGAKGDQGEKGETGAKGEDGIGVSGAEINDNGQLVISYSDGNSVNLGKVIGAKGDKGDQGEKGETGAKGDKGDTGEAGEDGVGISKVEVDETGNLTVTLTSGTELALGNIKGKDGLGVSGSSINEDGELVLTYTNGNTANLGKVVGKDGTDGTDGVGIKTVAIDEEGVLVVTLTNGTEVNLGSIKGEDGNSVETAVVNEEGHLILTYTNGNSTDCGKVTGNDGVSVANVTLTEEGELSVTLSNETVYNLGNIKGPKGDKGDQGEKGEDGRGVSSMAFNDDGELVVYYTDGTEQNLGTIPGGGDSREILKYTLKEDGTYVVEAGKDAPSVSEISIPATYKGVAVTEIREEGFMNLLTLRKVSMPEGITVINSKAFYGCTYLDGEIVIPATVHTIGESAFENCTNLSGEIYIPSAVTRICKKAFFGTSISTVTLENPQNWAVDGRPVVYQYRDSSQGSSSYLSGVYKETFYSKFTLYGFDYSYQMNSMGTMESATANPVIVDGIIDGKFFTQRVALVNQGYTGAAFLGLFASDIIRH